MIIDRSYAAALAASQEAHQHVQQQPQMITRTTSDNTGTFVIVQDQGIVGERPWRKIRCRSWIAVNSVLISTNHSPREYHNNATVTQTSVPTLGSSGMLSSSRQAAPLTSEFQCPECMKTYSCRKNVKRHRMAVHKLSAEEVSRPMSAAQSVGSMGDSPPLPPLGQQVNRMSVARNDYKSDVSVMGSSQQMVQHPRYQERVNSSWMNSHQVQNSHTESSWSRSREYVDDEESAETARIAAELKRSAEQEMAEIEGKKPRTELAEADTTFHEETETRVIVRAIGIITATPADVPHGTRSVPQSSASATARVNKRPPHVCVDCNRVLSSDYSLRRHRLTCVEARANGANQPAASSGSSNTNSSTLSEESLHLQDVMLGSACIGNDRNTDSMGMSDPMLSHVALSTPLHQQGVQFSRTPSLSGSGSASAVDEWYERHSLRKTDDVPDSTTSQRLDRSTSPGILATPTESSQPGCLQYTRKRANSGEVNVQSGGHTSRSQQHKHLCQSCGKFYSSEWNLERHRRESCPVKGKGASPTREPTDSAVNDETSVQVGHTLFLLSRSALSRASAYFAQLFAMHDPSKGELRLELDPTHFQSLLDVYNNPNNLNPEVGILTSRDLYAAHRRINFRALD
ncbi:zinc finger, C2H2 type [Teladorsagia circumcincta]|uniref:Zinc finger, C2H2 type n=1 Tax=Teladorsagia circumcincta TaxID=45464 RepID=A0A2G9TMR0_TELCI|nr:zinc finger, C2H2 type [Teladorsagia circumcincta]